MLAYSEPDMKVFDSSLLTQFKAFASSNTQPTCQSYAVVCNGGGYTPCSANSAGCGSASYCTTKSC